jgi:predicted phosphodiesterase
MRRLLVLADLHLDKWTAARRDPLAFMPAGWFDQFDMVILAGDVVDKPKVRLAPALGQIGQHVPLDRVQVFPGNHCFYDHVLDGEDRLAQIVTTAGAHYVQCRSLTAGRTRLLPCTLWTDLLHPTIHPDIIAADLERGMNDYRYIRMASAGYRRTWPSDMRAIHQRHIAWLREEMEKPHDGPTIVVTHHAPILGELGTTGTLTHAYGSDLTRFIGEMRPSCWLYGHTHQPHAVQVGGTSVRNMSLGYPSDLDDAEARARIEAGRIDLL